MDFDKFLEEKGLKQTDLARLLETSDQNVSKWVKGTGQPSYEYCRKLLILGMSTSDLFGIDADAPTAETKKPTTIEELVDVFKESICESLDRIKLRVSSKKITVLLRLHNRYITVLLRLFYGVR